MSPDLPPLILPQLRIDPFFDADTWTLSYLLTDPASGDAAVIDPVLDYDAAAARISHASADRLLERLRETGGRLRWILETHVHADHLSAASYLREQAGGAIAISAAVTGVQARFSALFDRPMPSPQPFDRLLQEGERLPLGALAIEALATPGHTPACMSFRIRMTDEALVFVGDTLFMPDYGTARCDFPGGDARALFRSINRLLALPPQTRLFMCHDYQPGGRPLAYLTTVAEQRTDNVQVRDGVSEDEFVCRRQSRDATLAAPRLILPALQVNLMAGQLPPPEGNGIRYLRLPLDQL